MYILLLYHNAFCIPSELSNNANTGNTEVPVHAVAHKDL